MTRFLLSVLLSTGLIGLLGAGAAEGQPASASAFPRWTVEAERETNGIDYIDVRLASQQWRGDTWLHGVRLIKPPNLIHPAMAMLVITGGSNEAGGEPRDGVSVEGMFAGQVARRVGSIAVIVNQVPNQPILGGRYEDGAIAHTFDRYLATGDATWPLLGPMTRSAIAAMDAAQAVARERWGIEIESFFVSGASKRGWTAWLTAAEDSRVAAIAPIVIDNLNMPAQMRHQIDVWGSYSARIRDYVSLNLPQRLGEPRARALIEMVDPYFRRERLTMPKLILIGTNDPYWVLDAARFYFDDLPGRNFLYYVPNGGHGPGLGATEAVQAFYAKIRSGEPLPEIEWTFTEDTGGGVTVEASAAPAPPSARVWRAESADRDFRDAQWNTEPLAPSADGRYRAAAAPGEGPSLYRAFYIELRYPSPVGGDFGLCTLVRVVGPPLR